MTAAKFTPGPWETEGHDGYERKRADGSPWLSLCVGTADGSTVAEVCVPSGEGWASPTAQANARLIAAAPDLLQACRDALATA